MDFKKSLDKGGVGEHVVWNLLMKQKGIRSVVDVRDDKKFQEKDVDFLVEDYNHQFMWVEVKTDYQAHKSGNIVYELTTSNHVGCFEKTKSEYIMYYLPEIQTVYMIHTKSLRNYVYQQMPSVYRMGDYAEGCLLKIEDLKKAGVIRRTYTEVI